MINVTVKELFEAGVHFGHRKRFWVPKMKQYIHGIRNGSHIIDLDQTCFMFNDALKFISTIIQKGGKILFVGTKMAASLIIEEEAKKCGMPYVNNRWLGGMLTNYTTVKQSIRRLQEFEKLRDSGGFAKMMKKEALKITRQLSKLEFNLAGIKNMKGLPDAIFIIDIGHENIAVTESNRLKIPVIGVVDTNNDPDGIDYIIPGNDDAMRSLKLYCEKISQVIIEAKQTNESKMLENNKQANTALLNESST